MTWEHRLEFARALDEKDELRAWRGEFCFPKTTPLYFVGNSLGLAPMRAKEYVIEELDAWRELGIEGHLHKRNAWYPYHEFLTESTARVAGAKPGEVVVMNSLSVNLHLMLTSFYRPTKDRFRILIEKDTFPSDRYAVQSQVKLHGFDPKDAIVEIDFPGADIPAYLEKHGKGIALCLLGDVNYLTGEAFPLESIAATARRLGVTFGVDLAHGIGNLELALHDWKVDFAVWCSYKYLNGGPGAIGGCFVHEDHARRFDWPRLAGWWGTNKQKRFEMAPHFEPMSGAEGWQLSNPPILQMAALRASMEIFDATGMPALRRKSEQLTAYLEWEVLSVPGTEILTPASRGAHLSLRVKDRQEVERLQKLGVACDYREPGILRLAPVPLYNSFEDIYRLGEIWKSLRKK